LVEHLSRKEDVAGSSPAVGFRGAGQNAEPSRNETLGKQQATRVEAMPQLWPAKPNGGGGQVEVEPVIRREIEKVVSFTSRQALRASESVAGRLYWQTLAQLPVRFRDGLASDCACALAYSGRTNFSAVWVQELSIGCNAVPRADQLQLRDP
jgi:hypothetical protein